MDIRDINQVLRRSTDVIMQLRLENAALRAALEAAKLLRTHLDASQWDARQFDRQLALLEKVTGNEAITA